MLEPYPKSFSAKLTCILIVLVAFVVLYQPWQLGDSELRSLEGFYATQALELDPSLPLSTAHGVAIRNAYFLFPMTLHYLNSAVDLPISSSLRLISIGMLFLLGGLVFIASSNNRDFKAGMVAFCVLVGNALIFEKVMVGTPMTMTMFFLMGAQLAWFYFGFIHTKWSLAWIASLTLLSLAFLSGGLTPVICFILPLIFMRRPLSVGPKLQKWGFALGLTIFAGSMLVWLLPYLLLPKETPIHFNPLPLVDFREYILNLVIFPWDLMVRLLPWTLLLWAPFCVAIRPQDETPIFSRYLRTIVVADAVLVWLNPFGNILDFMFCVAPLAILIGNCYETAVRRYSQEIRRMLLLCSYFIAFTAAAMILFCLLPENIIARFIKLSGLNTFKNNSDYMLWTLSTGNLLLLLSLWTYYYRKKGQVWKVLLASSCAMGLFYWSVMYPYRVKETERSELGTFLRETMKKETPRQVTIYKSAILDLYSECCYMGYRIRKISDLIELPKSEQVIYLLGVEFPRYPERSWSNLLPQDFTYRGQRLCLWRGELIKNKEFINKRLANGVKNE